MIEADENPEQQLELGETGVLHVKAVGLENEPCKQALFVGRTDMSTSSSCCLFQVLASDMSSSKSN